MSRTAGKSETQDAHLHSPFRVARVEKTLAPDGGKSSDWYRYVLDNGRSTITGLRQGPLKEVSAYAARCAEQINARGTGRTTTWSPRGRKPAAATNNGNT